MPDAFSWRMTSQPTRDETARAKGAALKAIEQPIDTGTAAGKCFLDMLGVFAEFETNLRRERQLEGIAKAKAAGVYKGRATVDRSRPCAQDEGRRHEHHGDSRRARHRPHFRLSGARQGGIGGNQCRPTIADIWAIRSARRFSHRQVELAFKVLESKGWLAQVEAMRSSERAHRAR